MTFGIYFLLRMDNKSIRLHWMRRLLYYIREKLINVSTMCSTRLGFLKSKQRAKYTTTLVEKQLSKEVSKMHTCVMGLS